MPKAVTLVSKKPHILKLIFIACRVIKNTVQVNKQSELNLRVNKLEKTESAVVLQGKASISIFLNECVYLLKEKGDKPTEREFKVTFQVDIFLIRV